MRFMVMVKATEESEQGVMPSTELLEAMGRYNEELVKAGVMVAGESEIEIRQIFEPDDFGEAFTPELREQEERLRAQTS